ncbi:hypothetical protein [Arundinibacter roseus]|uniref:T9SS type A sorting domain-containing protein n=1 Tax=Arundinibacter roseus TaxID=2070510 RepID=A0A4R4KBS7_9BACT|nr:hypothetical protein [Arundinibacter roseus]TDB65258.1 hypothetical protein EZE20_11170 [Arundinibacter roseus]
MKTINYFSKAALLGLLAVLFASPLAAQSTDVSDKTAHATPQTHLHVTQSKPMQFRVSYINPNANKIIVRILDAQDVILFNETSSIESNYVKFFDLSPLLDGTYTFEILDGKEKHSQSFDIMTQTRRLVSAIN